MIRFDLRLEDCVVGMKELEAGSIDSPRFLNDCHEDVFHFTPNRKTPLDRLALGVPSQDTSNIARWGHTGGRDRRWRGNTWFVP